MPRRFLPTEKFTASPRKWVAGIAGLALVTLTLNWLLLAALNRKEAEPRTSPPDYPAPSATP
ncbi:MAG: hypothetical protein WCC93_08645 [Chthoniobacterales bacterium]